MEYEIITTTDSEVAGFLNVALSHRYPKCTFWISRDTGPELSTLKIIKGVGHKNLIKLAIEYANGVYDWFKANE